MLLSSAKFEGKAQELLKERLEKVPRHVKLEKKTDGNTKHRNVTVEGPDNGDGGMMLYTSGTTSRPVNFSHHLNSVSKRPLG